MIQALFKRMNGIVTGTVRCPDCKGTGTEVIEYDDHVGYAGSFTDTCTRCEGEGTLPWNFKELEAEADAKATEFVKEHFPELEEDPDERWLPGLQAFENEPEWKPEDEKTVEYPVIKRGQIIRWESM